MLVRSTEVLTESRWLTAEAAHERAVDERVEAHLRRRATGEKHPVEDFLFTYYRHRPGALRR